MARVGFRGSSCGDLDPGFEFHLWEDSPPKPRVVVWTPQFMAELGWSCHTTWDWSFQMQPGTQNAEYSHYWRSAERVLPSRSLEIPMELSIHRSIQHLILVCFPVFKASKITELHLLTKPHFYFQEAQTFMLGGECYKIVSVNPLVFYFERFFDMFKAQSPVASDNEIFSLATKLLGILCDFCRLSHFICCQGLHHFLQTENELFPSCPSFQPALKQVIWDSKQDPVGVEVQ